MFEKNMRFAFLIDFYGEILDENAREIMRAYYEDDLSLSEIAESVGISRQGVRNTIKLAEEQLAHLEEKLGLARRYSDTREIAARLSQIRQSIDERLGKDGSDIIDGILEIEKNLLNKGV